MQICKWLTVTWSAHYRQFRQFFWRLEIARGNSYILDTQCWCKLLQARAITYLECHLGLKKSARCMNVTYPLQIGHGKMGRHERNPGSLWKTVTFVREEITHVSLVDDCRHCVTHLVRIPGRRFSINGADLFPFDNSCVITFRYKYLRIWKDPSSRGQPSSCDQTLQNSVKCSYQV